ncbi:DUF2637 domain-containing protein [Kitasatospora griseola]|uniref:DUF2637 domain-containing protein n=1 Tax=Kitasatospora griseola TaxID=2064 RepID=UPI0034325517
MKTIHKWMIGAVAVGALIIAAIGLGGSYFAVRDVAFSKDMGDYARVFPVGVDIGILVLLGLDLVLTWLRIPFPLLRPTAWAFTVGTIAFNASASWPDPLGVAMHGVIPMMFIVIAEAGRHAIARLAHLSSDRSIDRIRPMRWVLAPRQTFRLWRRMQLWEIRSLDEAINGEQARLTYEVLVKPRADGSARGRRRGRKASLPAAAQLPLQLADLGVPMSVTYEAGLAAAGVDAEPLTLLLAHQERARGPVTADRRPDDQGIAHAQLQPDGIALRRAIAQAPVEPIAQNDLAQSSPAQTADPAAQTAAHAQQNPVFAQVNDHVAMDAREEVEQVPALPGVAQLAAAPTGAFPEADPVRTGDAHGTLPDMAAQSGIAQLPADGGGQQGWQPGFAQSVPTARVSALGSATGPVVTQQTDDAKGIPSGWAEGFSAFVAECQRHPEQTELADFLYTRGFKSNKSGDGPVSQDSVRRYYNYLCERFPTPKAPTQPSLDLQATLVGG